MSIHSQELNVDSTAMNAHQKNYYKACIAIRNGVIENNHVLFDYARDLLRERITHLSPLVLDTINVSDEVPMNEHMYFTREYAKFLKDKIKSPFIDKGGLKGDDNQCMIMHHAVSPHGVLSYRAETDEAGSMVMFAVAEVGGKLSLNVIRNGISSKAQIYEDGAVAYLPYYLNEGDIITIEIKNETDKEISFVFASN